MSMVIATGYAYGSVKKKNYEDFLNSLDVSEKEIDTNKTIKDIKRFGIQIEEK